MREMSREANELVSAGRDAFHPTDADRARLMTAITGAATLSVGVAVAAGAQRSVSGIWGLVNAGRLLAVVLPVATAGAYFWHGTLRSPSATELAAPVRQPAVVVAAKATEPSVPVVEPVVVQPPEPSAPVAPERSAALVSEVSKRGQEIRQEVELLSKAQGALSRGRPQEALDALTEHARRFPRGVLTEERAATRVRTLCALGRAQEAEVELKRIEKRNPTSAYLARAREACGVR
jgi:hypothetical protein